MLLFSREMTFCGEFMQVFATFKEFLTSYSKTKLQSSSNLPILNLFPMLGV